MRLDEMTVEEVVTVEGEVVEEPSDDQEEFETEASVESDLNTALELLERAILLNDDLIDDRLKAKNNLSFRTSKRIQSLSSEIWSFLQTADNNDAETYIDVKKEMEG